MHPWASSSPHPPPPLAPCPLLSEEKGGVGGMQGRHIPSQAESSYFPWAPEETVTRHFCFFTVLPHTHTTTTTPPSAVSTVGCPRTLEIPLISFSLLCVVFRESGICFQKAPPLRSSLVWCVFSTRPPEAAGAQCYLACLK